MRTLKLLFLFLVLSQTGVAQQPFDAAELLVNLKTLSSDAYEGRGIGEPGNLATGEYLAKQFKALELKSFQEGYLHPFSFLHRFRKKKMDGRNYIAYVEGTQYKDQYIVISAHYDHLGNRNGEIYNGADDNASGTCALLAMAEYFSANPPLHSIIFAAFDAEEQGLEGADNFVEDPPVPREQLLVNINMDMISRNDNNELYVCGTRHYPFLKGPIKDIKEQTLLTISFGHDKPNKKDRSYDWTSASDHGEFHKRNIPFLYFGVEDHPDYHKPSDDFVRTQPAFYIQAVDFIRLVAENIDQKWESIR